MSGAGMAKGAARHLCGDEMAEVLAWARAWRLRNKERFDALFGAEQVLCRMCRRPLAERTDA